MGLGLIPQAVRDGVQALRRFGLRQTLIDTPAYLWELIFRTHQRAEREEAFDAAFGTDTTGIVMPWELASLKGAGPDAFIYEPTSGRLIREILRRIVMAPRQFVFIDLGSGKGRALLVASEFPFAKIVGVELSTELHAIAQANIKLYRPGNQLCRNFELRREDAAAFVFPPDPLVLFMFNPFGDETVARVLGNVGRSANEHRRPAFVAFVHSRRGDMQRFHALAMATDFMHRIVTTEHYSIYQVGAGQP
jgi:SAM-dependent methyltransferase